MRLSAHPVWLVGFRPFFGLACLSGLGLPVHWALMVSGGMTAPFTAYSPIQWHAHEMFFGFGWAVLGGFLLTATKNWVQIRGYHGRALMLLVAAWLFERAGMWFGGVWPPLLFRISNNVFLSAIVVLVMVTLVRHRRADAYRDNYFFLLILPMFLVAKNLMLSSDYFQIGWSMALGLFRMAFLVMLERTLTQFMKNAFQVSLLRNQHLDIAIKLLGLILVFESLLPPPFAGWLALLLGFLLTGRLISWKPQLAMRRLDIGIMYIGCMAIIAQLLLQFLPLVAQLSWVGSVSVHVFAFGVMGLIIPAMLIRISKGHTGRKAAFDSVDKGVLWIMMAAFMLRILAPQAYPASYTLWIDLAATCWFGGFALLGWRYIPYLVQPRVDGKEH